MLFYAWKTQKTSSVFCVFQAFAWQWMLFTRMASSRAASCPRGLFGSTRLYESLSMTTLEGERLTIGNSILLMVSLTHSGSFQEVLSNNRLESIVIVLPGFVFWTQCSVLCKFKDFRCLFKLKKYTPLSINVRKIQALWTTKETQNIWYCKDTSF